jgi:hypothetical protein
MPQYGWNKVRQSLRLLNIHFGLQPQYKNEAYRIYYHLQLDASCPVLIDPLFGSD